MEVLEQIKSECLGCRKCVIGGQQINGKPSNVFSNMVKSKIMIIGQNPGRDEVSKGEPFVGISGKFFDSSVLAILKLKREDLYISNTVKCFTPDNRKPFQVEIDNCRYLLDKEIELLQPIVIIALGGPAFQQLTGMNGIMKHHGKPIFSPRYKTFVIPVIHPSPLNTNRPDMRAIFFDDLKSVGDFLNENNYYYHST